MGRYYNLCSTFQCCAILLWFGRIGRNVDSQDVIPSLGHAIPGIKALISGLNSSHYGKHFVFGFNEQYSRSQSKGLLVLSIVAISDSNITIRTHTPNSAPIKNSSFVRSGETTELTLPNHLRMSGTQIERKGISVHSTGYISIVCLNYIDTTSDAYRPLPTKTLGTRYVVASYGPAVGEFSTFGVVSLKDRTTVRITLNTTGKVQLQNGNVYLNKETFEVNLDELHTFHVSHGFDLSGTVIEANYPVAVVSGDTCASVRYGNCDMLTTFLLPVKNWGKDFVFGTIGGAGKDGYGDVLRVFVYDDDTMVRHVYGERVLSKGEFIEIGAVPDHNPVQASFIQCSKACQVIQYITGRATPTKGVYVDSSMIVVPSLAQFPSHYRVVFPQEQQYDDHEVTLFIKADERHDLVIGDHLLSARWRTIEGTDFVWTTVVLPYNTWSSAAYTVYHVSYKVSFGLQVFGGTELKSYAYPGGFVFGLHKEVVCLEESVSTLHGVFLWPETRVGEQADVNCPRDQEAIASRFCEQSPFFGGVWGEVDAKACPLLTKNNRKIFEVSKTRLNTTNVISVGEKIKRLSFPGNNLISDDVSNIVATLENIYLVKEKLHEVGGSVLSTVDNVLDADTEVVEKSQQKTKSSARIVRLLDNLLENMNTTNDGSQRTFKNFVVDVSLVNPNSFHGLTFSPFSHGNYTKGAFTLQKDLTPFVGNISIHLPKTIFKENQNSTAQERIMFSIFKKTNFFPKKLSEEDHSLLSLNSYVISGSIKDRFVQNLENPIVISYKPLKEGNTSSARCVFWSARRDEWSREGCLVNRTEEDGTIVCHCNHLTNFAMLMDINTNENTAQERILGVISYVGCALSLLGLVLTIITILAFRELRSKVPAQMVLHFSIALSLTLVVFLTAAERSRTFSMTGCRVAAIALHYFILVTFTWTAMQAFNMYSMFVKVRTSIPPRFLTKCICIAWGLPVIVVAVTSAIAFDKYGGQTYCRLNEVPFLVALFCPVLLILVGNCVAFIAIFYSLLRRASKVTTDRKDSGLRQARQAAAVMVLLGLTWLFGVVAIGDAKEIFQYLFCIFNSLQGFFVFIFYCILSPVMRKKYHQLFKRDGQTKSTKGTRISSDARAVTSTLGQTRNQLSNGEDSPATNHKRPRPTELSLLSSPPGVNTRSGMFTPGEIVHVTLSKKDGTFRIN